MTKHVFKLINLKRFDFKNSCISCIALLFNSSNTKMIPANKNIGSGLQNTTIHLQFFSRSMWTNGLVVKASSTEWDDSLSWFQQGTETLCSSAAPRPFCVALNLSVHWHTRFHIAALIVLSICFSLKSRQWRSRWRDLTPNMNIFLPLLWSTWSRERGPDLATFAGPVYGHDCSYCSALEQKCLKRLGHCFSLHC